MAIFEFLSFDDPGTQIVTIGTVILGAVASIIGCFTFLQKRALIGDAISHSVLPGICLAFILSGTKNPYYMLIGAFISGWLSVILSDWITRTSKIKADTSIAIVLSFFFAIGMMMLSIIQHSGNVNQAGLHHFLFGKAAAIIKEDVVMFLYVAAIALVIIIVYFRAFKLYIFDIEFAKSIGLPVKWLDFLLTTLAVLAIALGIRAVGVVMMSALLIGPAAAASFWTGNLKKMLLISAIVGSLAGFFGAMISYMRPQMPTGPWIIIVLSVIAFTSIVMGTEKGVLHKWRKRQAFKNKVLRENILKIFYHLGENQEDFLQPRTLQELIERRAYNKNEILKGLNQLKSKHWVGQTESNHWALTKQGNIESAKLIRLHRLWEVYLSEHLNIAADHVHDDAEAIEHILTPKLQARLESVLKGRTTDPHDKAIPNLNKMDK
ncbi:MAG: iron chelate uptake ABC transporter family permease subunit [Chitinophagales bacterium]